MTVQCTLHSQAQYATVHTMEFKNILFVIELKFCNISLKNYAKHQ